MVAISNTSAAVNWSVIRRHSAFLHKRRSIKPFFSTDKFNLTGQYTTRSSGIAADAGVSVTLNPEKRGVIVEFKKKSPGAQHRPATSTTKTVITGSTKAIIASVGKAVKAYEPSLAVKAQKRTSQLLRSLQKRKARKNEKTAAAAAAPASA